MVEVPAFSLTGRTVVITGGGGILGQRMTAAMVAAGANVAVIDHDLAKATQAAEAGADKGRALPFAVDITDGDAVRAVSLAIGQAFGPVHGLVNNAAAKSANFFEPFETFPLADWNEVMGVNLTGAMICSQIFGAAMAERGDGSIVNTLSIYGIVAPDQRIYEGSEYEGRAINTPAVYSASKAGLWGLTRYLSSYWGHRNVRVNALTPGGVFSGQNSTFVDRYSARVPMGRMAQATEMSGALVFLLSDASSYVTGQNIAVDGGLTVW
ncbi:SDR family oxidoreductase [Devosia sp. Root635]|uniref:SDR family oxidoreductase n=1 Tax=Devosia sp. Root635 TaxID=1736575 RepID=UPI0006FF4206|nr:SDR family oxidoreductase [Devosia sp. Root635]KRA55356.1 short-chain dehydrogenase [Devosia sp. Root635]